MTGYLTWEEAKLLRLAGAAWSAHCAGWNTRAFFAKATASEVRGCVAGGDDVEARDEDGYTPLHKAEDPAVIETLVAAGADLEARNRSGRTPLYEAAGRGKPGNVSVVEALLAAGADPMARSDDDETLLHAMAEKEDAAPVVLAL